MILFAYLFLSNSLFLLWQLICQQWRSVTGTIYPEMIDQELNADTDLPWVGILFGVVILIMLLSIFHKRYLASVP